jgi:iron complex transport system substrate-binding protein
MLKIIFLTVLMFAAAGTADSIAEGALPERIISLTPATTEILFALGLDDKIIAVSSYCTWPVKAMKKEKIGSFSNPNIEKIITLKPDLVMVTGMEQENMRSLLARLGIKYISVDPKDIDELMSSIEQIGIVTGSLTKAKAINKEIRDVLEKIAIAVSEKGDYPKPRIYMEIWHNPIMSPGRGSFVDDMITRAGGINITSDIRRSYSRIDPEQIIFRNPEKIILAYMKPDIWVRENFSNRPGWRDIQAVKEKKIYTGIDPDTILRPGPRISQGLIKLHRVFYEK